MYVQYATSVAEANPKVNCMNFIQATPLAHTNKAQVDQQAPISKIITGLYLGKEVYKALTSIAYVRSAAKEHCQMFCTHFQQAWSFFGGVDSNEKFTFSKLYVLIGNEKKNASHNKFV